MSRSPISMAGERSLLRLASAPSDSSTTFASTMSRPRPSTPSHASPPLGRLVPSYAADSPALETGKLTPAELGRMKDRGEKIAMVTAYDATIDRLAARAGIHCIRVLYPSACLSCLHH